MVLRQIVDVVDAEVKSGTAHPISEDLPTLIRTLAGTTALMLTGDPLLVGRDRPRPGPPGAGARAIVAALAVGRTGAVGGVVTAGIVIVHGAERL